MRVLLLLAATASLAQGAVVFDAVTDGGRCVGCSTQSWSHPVAAGSHRVLYVNAGGFNNNVDISGITGTKGGVATAMTSIGTCGLGSNGNPRARAFYLLDPDTGSNAIVATMSTSAGGAQGDFISVTFQGVDATAAENFICNAGQSGNPTAGALTPSHDNSWVIDFYTGNNGQGFCSAGNWTGFQKCISSGTYYGSSGQGPIHPASSQQNTNSPSANPYTAIAYSIPTVNTCTITTASLPNWNMGTAYSQTIAVTGCSGSPVFSMTGAPYNWTIDSATGVISGPTSTLEGDTPIVNQDITLTVNVSDSEGSPTRNFTVQIRRVTGTG